MPGAPAPGSSLTILGGPLDGKRVILEDAVDEILIGSDSECRLCVDLPGVSPIHARLWIDLSGVTVQDTHSARGVYVNDERVTHESPLHDGDVLWLGPPGDEASVMVQCRFSSGTSPAPSLPKTVADEPPLAMELGEPEATPSLEKSTEVSPALTEVAPDEFFVEEEAASVAPALDDPLLGVEDELPQTEFVLKGSDASEDAAVKKEASSDPLLDEFFMAETSAPVEPTSEDSFFVEEPAPPSAVPAPAAPAPAEVPESVGNFFETAEPEAPSDRDEPSPAVIEPTRAPQAEPPARLPDKPFPPLAAAPKVDSTALPPQEPRVASAAPLPRPTAPTPTAPTPTAPAPTAPTPRRPARAEVQSKPERPAPALAAQPSAVRSSRTGLWVVAAGLGLLVAIGVAFFARGFLATPHIESLEPRRIHVGQTVRLSGQNFATDPTRDKVLFGTTLAKVTRADKTTLQVEVPELATSTAGDLKVPVSVSVDSRPSNAVEVAVYQSPRIHGLSPDVAMPGEIISLAGTGWEQGATVKFGSSQADVIETTPTSITVRVPSIEGGPGTVVPVVVIFGADSSNTAPFLIGRLPLIKSLDPASPFFGDIVTLSGRGFRPQTADNLVRIGGVRSLLLSASESELKLFLPRLPNKGEAPIEVRVRGLDNLASATLSLSSLTDPVEFRWGAEPYYDTAEHEHALLITGVGPAFVLSASGGRTASQRALEACRRLNEAAAALKASRDQDLEIRSLEQNPSIALVGKTGNVLEISEEDAEGYNEDWTKLGGRGGTVSRARLARWWLAVVKDLVLLLIRGDRPQHAGALAPEGRAFEEIYQAARKTGRFGVPREVVDEFRPGMREAMTLVALRVPAAVTGPSMVLTGPAAPNGPGVGPLKLEGIWTGFELEGPTRKYLTVNFKGNGGTLSYEGIVSMSVPMRLEEASRTSARFSVQVRGMRHYSGKWDGQKLTGTISSDASGRGDIGTFELVPGR